MYYVAERGKDFLAIRGRGWTIVVVAISLHFTQSQYPHKRCFTFLPERFPKR